MKRIGHGEEGTVYDLGNGRVKKVFSRGRVPLPYTLLKHAAEHGDITALPAVYETGGDYVIREYVQPQTKKCSEYYRISQTRYGGTTMYRHVLDGAVPHGMSARERTVYEWLKRLQYELSQVCGPTAGLGDFALKNLGETNDGRVILYDF